MTEQVEQQLAEAAAAIREHELTAQRCTELAVRIGQAQQGAARSRELLS